MSKLRKILESLREKEEDLLEAEAWNLRFDSDEVEKMETNDYIVLMLKNGDTVKIDKDEVLKDKEYTLDDEWLLKISTHEYSRLVNNQIGGRRGKGDINQLKGLKRSKWIPR